MSNKKQKPYLEFGGNVFYINLESILDVIKIDSSEEINNKPTIIVEEKSKKPKSKKKPEPIEETNPYYPTEEEMMLFREMNSGIQIDVSKWEILRLMIEAIMNLHVEVDDKLGIAGLNNSTPIPFKIAFNTLLKYNVLEEEE